MEIIESQSALGWKRLIELQPPYHGQSCHPPGPAAQGKARCDLSALPLKLFHSNQTWVAQSKDVLGVNYAI